MMVGRSETEGRRPSDSMMYSGMDNPSHPGECGYCERPRMLMGELRKPWGKGFRWIPACGDCIDERHIANINPFLFKGRKRSDSNLVKRFAFDNKL